ncbi:hypothetical protein B9Z55_003459 [Caenorhabditis nigoni]|uniref:Uncharacterized protein n=3 Tax=Caenorhabditis nigoni TaxID=1611254 RepID=A0A2G5VQG5_9PELO|nr:hypothetical protein B9Z55_003459 [Caenorhabditis nigoni]
MRRGSKILLGCLTTVTLFNLYRFLGSEDYKDWVEAEQDEIDMKSVFKRFDTNEIFQKWHNCISEQLLWIQDAEKFWNDFMFASKRCDLRANVAQIGLITLKNSDEMKHVIFPKIKMRKLGNNVTFYGADPVSMINDNLYSQIGTYFPLAIGSNSGISKAMVMVEDGGYAPKSIVHVDIVYFFKNLLNVTKIDNLWFDAEGAEFGDGFFEIFYKNGRFDQNSIDIFIEILHIIQYFGFFSAQLTNSFLIYLIIKKAQALFGAYRYVMGTFALFSLIYAWIEIATQPVMHIYGPIFVVYMDSPMKYEKWIGNDVTF